jgi:putative transposase
MSDFTVHTAVDTAEALLQDNNVPPETNVIVTELSEEAQLKLEVIQNLLEPCDRTTYGQKLKEAAEKLGVTVRTVQRLVKKMWC